MSQTTFVFRVILLTRFGSAGLYLVSVLVICPYLLSSCLISSLGTDSCDMSFVEFIALSGQVATRMGGLPLFVPSTEKGIF